MNDDELDNRVWIVNKKTRFSYFRGWFDTLDEAKKEFKHLSEKQKKENYIVDYNNTKILYEEN